MCAAISASGGKHRFLLNNDGRLCWGTLCLNLGALSSLWGQEFTISCSFGAKIAPLLLVHTSTSPGSVFIHIHMHTCIVLCMHRACMHSACIHAFIHGHTHSFTLQVALQKKVCVYSCKVLLLCAAGTFPARRHLLCEAKDST